MNKQNFKIARNTSYYTLALILQKLISFAYFSYVAVQIGAGSLGNYTFALFFTTIFAVIIDLGLSNVLVREVSKDQGKSQQYLASALSVKLPLAFLTYAIVIILINLIEGNLLVRQLVYLAGLIMILDSFTLTFYSFLRGHHNLKFESIGTVIFEVLIAVSGLIIISFTRDLRMLLGAILLGSLFNFVYSAILLKTKLKLNFKIKADKLITKSLLIITIPFALAAVFTRVYGYIDTVLLKQLVNETALGYYSIPYKITFSLQFIPMAFVASLYPAFASYYISAKDQLEKIFEKSLIYLGILCLPITFGILALAEPIMVKIYTLEFLPSVLPLQILILSLPFLFLNFPLGSLLNACNRQTRNTIHLGVVMVFNIILNLFLIPRYSFVGAAAASTISTFLMFCLQLYVARQIIPVNYKFLVLNFFKIVFSAVAMYLIIDQLKSSLNFLLLIPLGALIYGLLMYLSKGFDRADLRLIRSSFFKKPSND